jgi:hypothetical protein
MSMLPSFPDRRTVGTVAAVVVVVAATSRSVRQGAETVLFTTLIVAGVAVGVAALAVMAVIVIRSHRRQVRDRIVLPSSRAPAAGRAVTAIPAPPPLLPDDEPDQGLAEPLALEPLTATD